MRLFAAVALPEAVRDSIAGHVAARRAALPSASWVRPENLHLTLVFFGEVAPELVEVLAEALRGAAIGVPAFGARIECAGAFPSTGRVRVIWLGVAPRESFALLAEALRWAARSVGAPFDDKPFLGHVSLARCRRPWPAPERERLGALVPRHGLEFPVHEAALISSELAARGSRYSTVASLPLGGAS